MDEVEPIKIKITKHTIKRIRERQIINRKNIAEYLKQLFEQKTIYLYEGKHRDYYLYKIPDEGYSQPRIIVFIRLENNLLLSQTAYHTITTKKSIKREFFVTEVEIPRVLKTRIQALEEKIEVLETKKTNMGVQILSLQVKSDELGIKIYELVKHKEELQHNAKLRLRSKEVK